MARSVIVGLFVFHILLGATAPGQENDAVRTCDAYYRGEDAAAVEAAAAWIENGGGALASYFLGRIHLAHGRPGPARDAFRAGLKILHGDGERKSRHLATRLKRLDRVAGSLARTAEKTRSLQQDLARAAEASGRALLDAGWKGPAVTMLTQARRIGPLTEAGLAACREHEIADTVAFLARRDRAVWETRLPGGNGGW